MGNLPGWFQIALAFTLSLAVAGLPSLVALRRMRAERREQIEWHTRIFDALEREDARWRERQERYLREYLAANPSEGEPPAV